MWQRVKEQFGIEYERYTRTKFGKLGAICIYYVVFMLLSPTLNLLLPWLSLYLQEAYVFTIVMMVTIVTTFVLWNLGMMAVYKLKLPFLEQYRVNPDKLWPWEQNQQKWQSLMRRSLVSFFLSVIVVAPILVVLSYRQPDFKVVMDMQYAPTFLEMLPHLIIMAVVEDLFFFWSHLAFHHPLLYRFHKVHHEYTITVSVAGFHFHLFEALVIQQINAGIYMKVAMIYAPIHVSTLVYWYIFRTWDAYNGHCGYIFPWTPLQLIPFCTNDEYHDFHHTQNSGNYGSFFRFWDILFGYTKSFRDHKLKKREIKQE